MFTQLTLRSVTSNNMQLGMSVLEDALDGDASLVSDLQQFYRSAKQVTKSNQCCGMDFSPFLGVSRNLLIKKTPCFLVLMMYL